MRFGEAQFRGEASTHLSAETVDRMVATVLHDGTSVEIEGAGHTVMLDQPERLCDAIAAFLQIDRETH